MKNILAILRSTYLYTPYIHAENSETTTPTDKTTRDSTKNMDTLHSTSNKQRGKTPTG